MYVGDIKLAGKKQNIDQMWKVLNKEVDLGEPTSFLDHVYLGCTQRQCEISKRCCSQLQNHVRIQNFRRRNGKTAMLGKSEYRGLMTWSCQEMRGTILRVGLDDHHFKEEDEFRGRIVKSMLSNCSEMPIIGTHWTTRFSMFSEQSCTINH